MLLNGHSLTLSIPEDKRSKAIQLLDSAIVSNKVTICFIQKLTGNLNFLNQVLIPGRTFTRRMYDKLKLKDNSGNPLKQYHHISLDSDFKRDCKIWKTLLSSSEVRLCRPFVDVDGFKYAHKINFYSDASMQGMGAVFKNRFIVGRWGHDFIHNENPSIEFLELYALYSAL